MNQKEFKKVDLELFGARLLFLKKNPFLSNHAQTSLPIEPIIPAQTSLAVGAVGYSKHAVRGEWSGSAEASHAEQNGLYGSPHDGHSPSSAWNPEFRFTRIVDDFQVS